ncbi:MAG: STAS domain-containing protein [Flammeovirgaceae bacterium]
MRYSIEKTEKYTKFSLDEEKMDTLIAPEVKSEFVALFQSGTKNLLLDMSTVKYVDSSGLSSLLVAHRMAQSEEGCLVLVGISDHVMKLINISKLDQVFTILPTVQEGIDAIFLHELEQDLKTESGEGE